MKTKTSILIGFALMVFVVQIGKAQEFSFNFYFEDAAGHLDTITLGYDPAGTDGVDSQFGEVNIIDVPLKNTLDVRISDEWDNRFINQTPGTWHSKIQIIEKQECGIHYSINSIDIFTNNWPVTVSWDSTLFTNPCLEASLFTSVMPYGWWDTGGFLSLLPQQSSLVFEPNENSFSEYYDYVNSNNDTIHVFWQTFADSALIMSSEFERSHPNKRINIFPNPANSIVNFSVEGEDHVISGSVFSIQGEAIKEFGSQIFVDVSGFSSGMYFLKLNLKSGSTATTKLLIE